MSSPTASVTAADALLGAALSAGADLFWLEPVPGTRTYAVTLERAGRPLATARVDAGLGALLIARLAYIVGIDLTAARVTTGAVRLRGEAAERELVFTLRPGVELRGEALLLLPRGAGPRLPADDVEELAPGAMVDHYRVGARLGHGGMGAVYGVEHVPLGRAHALKVLHGRVLRRDADAIDRFLREARAASRIRHPNIVDVIDFGYLPGGRPYFVMELLEGEGLHRVIARGALPPARAIAVAGQLGEALVAAHAAGVIHADVSASNTIVGGDGGDPAVKLCDFGLAELRPPPGAPRPPDSALCAGTPCYIPPELVRGRPADERSDQYSFGVVLYEMLAGRLPFIERDVELLCMQHVRDPVPPLVSPHGPLPPALVKIANRALAKAPAQRFPSMRALLAELDDVARAAPRAGWQRWLRP